MKDGKMNSSCAVMILTGGSSSRFGSDKSRALLGDISLLDHLLISLPEEFEIIIVGPEIEVNRQNLRCVVESPIGGGPVAAIDAGLALVDTEFVVIVATDMPFASRIVVELLKKIAKPDEIADGLIPLDVQNVRQSLCALYRPDSLRRALATMGKVDGKSMRELTALLDVEDVKLSASLEGNLLDIDTQEDLSRATTFREKMDPGQEMLGGEK